MTRWCRFAGDRGPQVGRWDADGVRAAFVGGAPLTDLSPVVSGAVDITTVDLGDPVDSWALEPLEPLGRYPRNLFCVGKNYREHAAEFSASGYDATSASEVNPEHPVVFTKPASSIIGTGAAIPLHPGLTSELDYEAELAVIIGRGGRAIGRRDAFDHVFGYTLVNDVTARDLQRRHRQWFLGKGLDGCCPVGPSVVTADELDLGSAQIECRVNGELRQKAAVSDLIFDVPTLITTISAGITLVPGDVISTGTPAGVGIGFSPPRFLGAGDEVSVTLDPIGTLTNKVG